MSKEFDGYIIRQVNGDDIEVLTDSFVKVFNRVSPKTPWDFDHARAYMLYWLEKEPNLFYAAFRTDNNLPIAVKAVNLKPWRTGIRTNDGFLFSDTDIYIKGANTNLFKTVLTEAKEKYGANMHEVITFSEMGPHWDWFKRLGIKKDRGAVLMKGDIDEILKNLNG